MYQRRVLTVARTESGGFLATSAASSCAMWRCCPSGATRLMIPAARASSAVKKRPVSATSLAKAAPPRKFSRAQYFAPPRPRDVSVTWNFVPASATIKSHSSTMPSARPIA